MRLILNTYLRHQEKERQRPQRLQRVIYLKEISGMEKDAEAFAASVCLFISGGCLVHLSLLFSC